jgi:hypothetical protein
MDGPFARVDRLPKDAQWLHPRRQGRGRLRLWEVSERARNAEEVRLFLTGVTHFVCNEVSQVLATSDSPLSRDRMAEEAIGEMSWTG